MLTSLQERAADNLAANLEIGAKLPQRVFNVGLSEIYVMDFERLLRKDTVNLLQELIRCEGSSTAIVAQLGEDQQSELTDDMFLVSLSTDPNTYWSFITRNSADFARNCATAEMQAPWSIFAMRMGICSDLGAWCIYGEKFAEVALLAFKQGLGEFLEKRLFSDFGVERLADALKRETFFGEPNNEYSTRQRAALRAAYLL